MTTEKKKKFIIDIIFLAVVFLLVYFCITYLLKWLLPFVIGFLLALAIQKPIIWISGKTRVRRKIIAPILTTVIVLLVLFLFALLVFNTFDELATLAARLPELYSSTIPSVTDTVNGKLDGLLANLPYGMDVQIRDVLSAITTFIQSELMNFSSTALSWIANKATVLPSVLVGIVVSIVSMYFISNEYNVIKYFALSQVPKKYKFAASNAFNTFLKTVSKMLKAYGLIMLITFVELAIGLTILRVDYSVVLALLISLVDIFPIVGTGTILIPWALIDLIMGNVWMGVGVLIIYAVILIVRNILEPRIVGRQIGMPPLVTLIAMYLGLRIFGIVGVFLFPLALIMLKKAQETGLIRIWNVSEDENGGEGETCKTEETDEKEPAEKEEETEKKE